MARRAGAHGGGGLCTPACALAGANDRIITTFAVVASVACGDLAASVVLIMGAANLAADGVAMGIGNLLARTRAPARRRIHRKKRSTRGSTGWGRWRPLSWQGPCPSSPHVTGVATVMTAAALFGVGAARAAVTVDRWMRTGLETLARVARGIRRRRRDCDRDAVISGRPEARRYRPSFAPARLWATLCSMTSGAGTSAARIGNTPWPRPWTMRPMPTSVPNARAVQTRCLPGAPKRIAYPRRVRPGSC